MRRAGWGGSMWRWTSSPTAHRFTALIDDVRAGEFEDAVLLGMGGSSLCPEVLSLTFAAQTAGLPRLRVLDSTDPQQITTLRDELDLAKDAVLRLLQVGYDVGAQYLRGLLPRARHGSARR